MLINRPSAANWILAACYRSTQRAIPLKASLGYAARYSQSARNRLPPDQTPRPSSYSEDHPAFPSLAYQRKLRFATISASLLITLYTFYSAYDAVVANDNEQEDSEQQITSAPISQHEQVQIARLHPAVFLWGSNKHRLVDPESDENDRLVHSLLNGKVLRDLAFSDRHAGMSSPSFS